MAWRLRDRHAMELILNGLLAKYSVKMQFLFLPYPRYVGMPALQLDEN